MFCPKAISADVKAALQLQLNTLVVEDKLSKNSKAVGFPNMYFVCGKRICLCSLI